jgi:uncharacterized protein (DUF1499 family)
MVIAVSFCCETKYKPQRGHEAVANFPENTLSKLTALIGLMLTTMTASANEESARPPSSREIIQQTLTCLAPSNCVNSFSSYGLEALVFEGNAEQAMNMLRATLATYPEATIVKNAPLYLEVIFTTRMGFQDQVEFYIDEPSKRIEYRSRSKFGLYDFNKNRSRMQDFSTSFKKITGTGESGDELKPP